jgi:hypothetical protein
MYPKGKRNSQAKAGYKMLYGSQGCEYKYRNLTHYFPSEEYFSVV